MTEHLEFATCPRCHHWLDRHVPECNVNDCGCAEAPRCKGCYSYHVKAEIEVACLEARIEALTKGLEG